jgi:succinate dehydrogenase/fumarate reductase cytochrome b subunit
MRYFSTKARLTGLAFILFLVVVVLDFVRYYLSTVEANPRFVHIQVPFNLLSTPVAFLLGVILIAVGGQKWRQVFA